MHNSYEVKMYSDDHKFDREWYTNKRTALRAAKALSTHFDQVTITRSVFVGRGPDAYELRERREVIYDSARGRD